MSGLFAVRSPSGPTRATAERALATLAYRGADGRGLRRVGPATLGRQVTWTTPAAVGETGPIEVAGVWVTFAGRLDARDRLAGALPATVSLSSVSDARLFGYGYAAWGTDVFDRTIGAFTVAVYDPRADRLVCGRDPTGIRELFVAETTEGLAVASDARTLRCLPGVGNAVSDRALVTLLRRAGGDGDEAPFADVGRLPPGSFLVVDEGGSRRERYWHPADGPSYAGESRAQLAARLRRRVCTAVTDRLRCRGRPGVSLSGGLDSTVLAGVAAGAAGPTPTAHSLVFERVADDALTDAERERIADTIDQHGLTGHSIVGDPYPPLSEPGVYAFGLRESPVIDPLRPAMDRLHEQARSVGCRVLLSGTGGNALDGSRLVYADLLRRGRLVRLARLLRRDDRPTRWLWKWYALAPLVPALADRLTATDEPSWLGPAGRAVEPGEPAGVDRCRRLHRRERRRRQAGLDRALSTHAALRRGLSNGLVFRFPYRDARVVSLAYGLPGDVLFDGGRKALFRVAFAETVPASVRRIRAGRGFGAFVVPGLRDAADQLAAAGQDSRLERRGLLAEGAYADALDRFTDGDDGAWSHVWTSYACERWLGHLETVREREATAG